jgi:hypothetical protein
MAKSFQPVGRSAVHVLARLAAQNAVKEKLRDEGVRLSLVPIRQITEQAQRYLAEHPELWDLAREHALKLGMIQPPMVTPDDPRADQNS